jgi:hypothetical protein
MPKWMAAAGVVLGLALWYRAFEAFWGGEGKPAVFNALLGAVCVYGAGISRRLYLSDVGVVRETHSWGRVLRRVLPWRNVRSVSLAFRGDKMMAFFEEGATGWKVLFSKDQESLVMDVLDETLPDIEVEIIERR